MSCFIINTCAQVVVDKQVAVAVHNPAVPADKQVAVAGRNRTVWADFVAAAAQVAVAEERNRRFAQPDSVSVKKAA
jgi:phage replication-related protein YjqB (UPF0714/DUF867 family)